MHDGASTLMSIRDAAQATGLSPKALRRRIERGTLTSVMIGGRRRIPMEALARRGLIVTGHHPISSHRLVERVDVTDDAIQDRLHRLESRVSALEAVLATPVDGADGAKADGTAITHFGAERDSIHVATAHGIPSVDSAGGTGLLPRLDGHPAPSGVDGDSQGTVD